MTALFSKGPVGMAIDPSPLFKDCRAILFDFGGTLDSDGEHWLDRFFELYGEAGLDLPRSEIRRAFYLAESLCCRDPQVKCMGLRPLMALHVRFQLKSLGIDEEEKATILVEGFCRKSEQVLRRNARLLATMRKRFKLGVISNFYGNMKILCREAGLANSLDVILDSMEVGFSKPDLEIFRIALKRLKFAPEAIVFIGDSYERDMVPARSLGMKTVWLKDPRERFSSDAGFVDASIGCLMELGSLLP